MHCLYSIYEDFLRAKKVVLKTVSSNGKTSRTSKTPNDESHYLQTSKFKERNHLLALTGDTIVVCGNQNLKQFMQVEDKCKPANILACTNPPFTCVGTNITEINAFNHFAGDLPTEIALLTNLKSLMLFIDDIKGTIPTELVHIKGLETLVFGSQQQSGTIPSELGRLTRLQLFIIDATNMTGSKYLIF